MDISGSKSFRAGRARSWQTWLQGLVQKGEMVEKLSETFNPEELTNQKKVWMEFQARAKVRNVGAMHCYCSARWHHDSGGRNLLSPKPLPQREIRSLIVRRWKEVC